MNGEELHGIGPRRRGRVEAPLVLLGGGNVSQERGQAGIPVQTGELGGHVEEGRQVVAPTCCHGLRAGRQLDV